MAAQRWLCTCLLCQARVFKFYRSLSTDDDHFFAAQNYLCILQPLEYGPHERIAVGMLMFTYNIRFERGLYSNDCLGLPPELFIIVLEMVKALHPLYTRYQPGDCFLSSLMLVCKKWRDFITGSHSLWTTLHMNPLWCDAEFNARLYLCGTELPLSIWLEYPAYSDFDGSDLDYPDDMSIDITVERVEGLAHRCKELFLHCPIDTFMCFLRGETVYPILKLLDFRHVDEFSLEHDTNFLGAFELCKFPSLNTLQLWISISPLGLSLAGASVANITSLFVRMDHPRFPHKCLGSLQLHPLLFANVTWLHLAGCKLDEGNKAIVEMPQLLSLIVSVAQCDWLQWLHTPNLNTVQLRFGILCHCWGLMKHVRDLHSIPFNGSFRNVLELQLIDLPEYIDEMRANGMCEEPELISRSYFYYLGPPPQLSGLRKIISLRHDRDSPAMYECTANIHTGAPDDDENLKKLDFFTEDFKPYTASCHRCPWNTCLVEARADHLGGVYVGPSAARPWRSESVFNTGRISNGLICECPFTTRWRASSVSEEKQGEGSGWGRGASSVLAPEKEGEGSGGGWGKVLDEKQWEGNTWGWVPSPVLEEKQGEGSGGGWGWGAVLAPEKEGEGSGGGWGWGASSVLAPEEEGEGGGSGLGASSVPEEKPGEGSGGGSGASC